MTDRTATPARTTKRAQGVRPGGPSGRLAVGEYVGQAAADAAQAVRRAGLRPGLDRSFGCESELIGQVVAQDPFPGSDLARNGMVMLFVAAPGVASVDDGIDAPPAEGLDAAPPAPSPQAVMPQADAPPARARPRRPRKTGLAARAPQVFGTPTAPLPPDRALAGEAQTRLLEAAPTQAWASTTDIHAATAPDGAEHGEEVPDDRGDDELSHDEFVVHVDDLFAGRASRRPHTWRRVYPRERTTRAPGGDRRVRAWLSEHPWLVTTASAMLAMSLVLGVAVTLASHPARMHRASVVSVTERRATGPPTFRTPDRVAARTTGIARAQTGSSQIPIRPRRRAVARPSPRAALASAAAHPKNTDVQPAPSPRPAAPEPASPPAAPAQEQTPGGPFSP